MAKKEKTRYLNIPKGSALGIIDKLPKPDLGYIKDYKEHYYKERAKKYGFDQ